MAITSLFSAVVEQELRRQHCFVVDVHLGVHVHRPAGVPAGVHGVELDDAVGVGDLRAAEERRALASVVLGVAVRVRRVVAVDVAVPDLDGGAGEWHARAVDDLHTHPQWEPCMALGDVASCPICSIVGKGPCVRSGSTMHVPSAAKSEAVNTVPDGVPVASVIATLPVVAGTPDVVAGSTAAGASVVAAAPLLVDAAPGRGRGVVVVATGREEHGTAGERPPRARRRRRVIVEDIGSVTATASPPKL